MNRVYHDELDELAVTHTPCESCGGCLTCAVHWNSQLGCWSKNRMFGD